LHSSLFSECAQVVDPSYYHNACKLDMCECPGDTCHCEVLAAYARACENAKSTVYGWREATGCQNVTSFRWKNGEEQSGEQVVHVVRLVVKVRARTHSSLALNYAIKFMSLSVHLFINATGSPLSGGKDFYQQVLSDEARPDDEEEASANSRAINEIREFKEGKKKSKASVERLGPILPGCTSANEEECKRAGELQRDPKEERRRSVEERRRRRRRKRLLAKREKKRHKQRMRALKKELMSTGGSSERAKRRRRRMRRRRRKKRRQKSRRPKSFPLSWSAQKAAPFEMLRPEGAKVEEQAADRAADGERDLALLLESAKQRLAARTKTRMSSKDRTPLPLRDGEMHPSRHRREDPWSRRDVFKRVRRRQERRRRSKESR